MPKGLPQFVEYFWPTVLALQINGGSATISEIEDEVATLMELDEGQLAIPRGEDHRSQFQYSLAWVRTYLKKDGVATNSERGVWSLTERGETLKEGDARAIRDRVNAAEAARRKALKSNSPGNGTSPPAPKTTTDIQEGGLGEDESSTDDELLRLMQSMSPDAFERLSKRILRESGFIRVDVTGKSGDGGIDGVGILRVNLVSFQVVFQCKRYKGSVGPNVIRDFRGGMMGRAEKGLVITTGTFTAEARKEATRAGAAAIDLVDGEALCQLLKELKLGVKPITAYEVDSGFFETI